LFQRFERIFLDINGFVEPSAKLSEQIRVEKIKGQDVKVEVPPEAGNKVTS
jgi:hypothetical protein